MRAPTATCRACRCGVFERHERGCEFRHDRGPGVQGVPRPGSSKRTASLISQHKISASPVSCLQRVSRTRAVSDYEHSDGQTAAARRVHGEVTSASILDSTIEVQARSQGILGGRNPPRLYAGKGCAVVRPGGRGGQGHGVPADAGAGRPQRGAARRQDRPGLAQLRQRLWHCRGPRRSTGPTARSRWR